MKPDPHIANLLWHIPLFLVACAGLGLVIWSALHQ